MYGPGRLRSSLPINMSNQGRPSAGSPSIYGARPSIARLASHNAMNHGMFRPSKAQIQFLVDAYLDRNLPHTIGGLLHRTEFYSNSSMLPLAPPHLRDAVCALASVFCGDFGATFSDKFAEQTGDISIVKTLLVLSQVAEVKHNITWNVFCTKSAVVLSKNLGLDQMPATNEDSWSIARQMSLRVWCAVVTKFIMMTACINGREEVDSILPHLDALMPEYVFDRALNQTLVLHDGLPTEIVPDQVFSSFKQMYKMATLAKKIVPYLFGLSSQSIKGPGGYAVFTENYIRSFPVVQAELEIFFKGLPAWIQFCYKAGTRFGGSNYSKDPVSPMGPLLLISFHCLQAGLCFPAILLTAKGVNMPVPMSDISRRIVRSSLAVGYFLGHLSQFPHVKLTLATIPTLLYIAGVCCIGSRCLIPNECLERPMTAEFNIVTALKEWSSYMPVAGFYLDLLVKLQSNADDNAVTSLDVPFG
ncbi:hypothetical protein SeLEV6574_g08250 [Synchytrium endobioticum]|uniref:Transcription factor domain-containing protein n=1 Tax=Synchytrium endobioticum TaxID=286115 RepID=A0A507C9Y9_9FUNG|nr:hypothetical protein SeLEV6574_g08250 [Synchytrium endobioticum]